MDNDASGASVALKQEILQSQGFETRIYCRLNESQYPNVVVWDQPVAALTNDHFFMTSQAHLFSFGWETDMFEALSLGLPGGRKVVYFHGITPREFVPPYMQEGVDRSYAQLLLANQANVFLHATTYSGNLARVAGIVDPHFVKLPLPLDLPHRTATQRP